MRRAEAGIQVDKFYPPTDWLDNSNKQIDIRKNAENNSIVLLVGHSADFSKYSLLGLLVDTSSGTYDVYIDDVLVGSGITKNTQYDIDFSTINTSYGSATTPEALVLHKVVIKPNTNGEKITAFKCARTSGASGQQAQGILWCHFELINAINFVDLFYYTGYKNTNVLGLTAKNNELNCGSNISYAFNSTQLQFVPLLKIPNNTTFFYLNTGNTKLKREIIKGGTVTNQYGLPTAFYGNSNLEQVIIDSDTSNVSSATNVFENDIKLKKIPIKDYISATNMGSFITNAQSLYPTKLDVSKATNLTKIGSNGTSNISMRGLRGLKVSNEAPFNGSSPQININYTGLDRDAIIELFTSLPYNVGYEIVGSPTINNGVVSGFSFSDYIKVSNFPIASADSWEICVKATPDTSVTTQQRILGCNGFYLRVINGSSWNCYFANGGEKAIVNVSNANYIKLKKINNDIKIFYSLDGVSFTEVSSTVTIGSVTDGELTIGGGSQNWQGTLDLNGTYIKINDVYWFRGQAQMTKTLSLVGATGNNLTKVGSPTIDENGVASGFSDSDYLSFSGALNTTFEFKIKLRLTQYSSVNGKKCFLGWTGGSGIIAVGVINTGSENVLMLSLSTNSSSWNIAEEKKGTTSLNLDTDYYVKFSFNGTQYKLDLSADDVSYNNEITVNSTALINNGNAFQLCFGKSRAVASWYFLGSIYLNNTYAKIGNNYIVKGYLTDNDKNIALNKGWALTLS